MVSESISAKCSYTSEVIYDLIVMVFRLEMQYHCCLQFVHVAGTRIIRQGIDRFYIGDMIESIIKGWSSWL